MIYYWWKHVTYTVSADYCYFVIVQVSLISTARHGPYTRRIQKLQCQWWRCQWYSSKTGLFWFFIIFLDFNLLTIIGTSGRAWCRNEGKYGTATDIVFTPTKNIYDIVTSDLLISWQINCQTKVLSLKMVKRELSIKIDSGVIFRKSWFLDLFILFKARLYLFRLS